MSTALVTGVAGQDGVLLARDLLARGDTVVGTVLPGTRDHPYVGAYLGGVVVVEHDLRDGAGLAELLATHRPDVVYNLAALSSVAESWGRPEAAAEVNGLAVLRLLDVLVGHREQHGTAPRLVQASTADMLRPAADGRCDETSPVEPRNPYAAAKAFAHHLVATYREARGLHASSAVLFNHEHPLRGSGFVTRRITRAAVEIAEGRRDSLTLGTVSATRDWGAALDHVAGLRLLAEQDEPGDVVLGTGVLHSVAELVEVAFAAAGVADPWRRVRTDESLLRSSDAVSRWADATRAHERLGWAPSYDFEAVVGHMVRADLARVRSGVEESEDYLLP